MNLRVLGCSGAEFPGYNHSGFLLGEEIMFDAGSLTNVLDEKAQSKIKHIFITHAHLDHIKGIPFLADNITIGNWRNRVQILSTSSIIRLIKKHLLNRSMWPDLTVFPTLQEAALRLVALETDRSVKLRNYIITPYKTNHSVPSVGYLVENMKGLRFFYTGDTGPSNNLWKKIGNRQIHCLIIEVSLPNRMKEMALNTGHLTPQLLRNELSKMGRRPEAVCVTHLKPQYFNLIKRELGNLRVGNIRLLKEGDSILL